MDWKASVFNSFRLYAVTDIRSEGPEVLRSIEAAYRGGTDIIQLRSKVLPDSSLIRLGLEIRGLAQRYRKLFFMNDRVDLALVAGADGVHLGQEDMSLVMARGLIQKSGHNLWIGKSTHSMQQATAAIREGADYIGVGPVFETPTKPNAKSVGLGFVRQAAAKVRIPWVAIGGIDHSNIDEVMKAGATRVAVVRAVFAARKPELSAKKLKLQLQRFSINFKG